MLWPPAMVCNEKENGRQIEMIWMFIIIVLIVVFAIIWCHSCFLFASKAPAFLLAALASLRQSLANKAPWNWKVNWNWMEGGDPLSFSRFFSAAGKAGLGLAQKETKGSSHTCVCVCVSVFGYVHMSVCVCVPTLPWSQGNKVYRGIN